MPASADEAVAMVAATPGAAYLAGGTNLVDLMKLGVSRPGLLVDVAALPGATTVERTGSGGLRIGAAVRNADLAAHRVVRRDFPVLAHALLHGASGQLRNMATVGGNLLQRTRCAYFQDVTKPCNKREPGTGCPARDGEHRNLAVLGTSAACIASNPSDMLVALAALDATVTVLDLAGERRLGLLEVLRLPGDQPHRDTTLAREALVTAVEIPPMPAGMPSCYRKVRDRASFAFAVVSVAAGMVVADGVVAEIRLALGGIAPVPWRASRAETALLGGPASRVAFRHAAALELEPATPLQDNAFKVPLTVNLVAATLAGLVGAGR